MENIFLCTKNVLEKGTVTIGNIGTEPGYPVSRLYDADRNDLWMGNQAAYFSVMVGSLPSPEECDFLAISRHNLAGETMTWKAGGATIHQVPSMPSGDYHVALSSPSTASSFEVGFTTPANKPTIAEITISKRILNKHPNFPGPVPRLVPNIDTMYTRSGHRWAMERGSKKWAFSYQFTLSGTEMAEFLIGLDDIDYGLRPFYMYDHSGDIKFVELMTPLELPYEIPGHLPETDSYQTFTLDVQEVF